MEGLGSVLHLPGFDFSHIWDITLMPFFLLKYSANRSIYTFLRCTRKCLLYPTH